MFERFTRSARDAVVLAQVEARSLQHNYIGTEHLLLGLFGGKQEVSARVLERLGVRPERMRQGIIEIIGTGAASIPVTEPDPEALDAIGIDLDAIRRRVEEAFGPGALDRTRAAQTRRRPRRGRFRLARRSRCETTPGIGPPGLRGHIPFTPRAKKVLELALREALHLNHRHIGTEHILLGLIREGEGVAALLLSQAGIDLALVRTTVLEELGRPA
ncbi:MAG: Clp protease N-terminal domain-containing protein [Actinomycetota bacterium]